jgi:hypothetical protein
LLGRCSMKYGTGAEVKGSEGHVSWSLTSWCTAGQHDPQ